MVTTGSKLCFAATAAGVVAAVVYGLASQAEALGLVVLVTVAAAAAFLGSVLLVERETYVDPVALRKVAAGERVAPATAAPVVTPSIWPLGLVVSGAMTVVGMVGDRRLLVGGIVGLVATGLGWSMQATSDGRPGGADRAARQLDMASPFTVVVLGVIMAFVGFVGFSTMAGHTGDDASRALVWPIGLVLVAAAIAIVARPRLTKLVAWPVAVVSVLVVFVASVAVLA